MEDEILTYDKLLKNKDMDFTEDLIKKKYMYKYLYMLNRLGFSINNLSCHFLSVDEMNEVVRECFCKIFKRKTEKLDYFQNSTTIYQANNLTQVNGYTCFDGYLGTNQFNLDINLLIVPSYEGVITIIHEYAHAMEIENYPVYQNIYYKELFAIMIEIIASIYINSILGNDSIELNQKKIRLAYTSKTATEYLNSKYSIGINSREKRLNEYDNLTYIISTLYALELSNYYKYYPNNFILMLNRIASGELKLEGLIKYYDINLESKETINSLSTMIKKLNFR